MSQEHLNAAVGLYEELRKLSSSGKISWAKHRQMMISEGFDDSDKNESYRQMIKVEKLRIPDERLRVCWRKPN